MIRPNCSLARFCHHLASAGAMAALGIDGRCHVRLRLARSAVAQCHHLRLRTPGNREASRRRRSLPRTSCRWAAGPGSGPISSSRRSRASHGIRTDPFGRGRRVVVPTLLIDQLCGCPRHQGELATDRRLARAILTLPAVQGGRRCLCDVQSAARSPARRRRLRDAQNIADILVNPEGVLERRSRWEKTSPSLLVGAILLMLYAEEEEEEEEEEKKKKLARRNAAALGSAAFVRGDARADDDDQPSRHRRCAVGRIQCVCPHGAVVGYQQDHDPSRPQPDRAELDREAAGECDG